MDDLGTNQCGLRDQFTPCAMEEAQENPDWDKCEFGQDPNRLYHERRHSRVTFNVRGAGDGKYPFTFSEWKKLAMEKGS